MTELKIRSGPVRYLDLEDEIKLTEIMASVIKDYEIVCYAYNVCRDHVHMIVHCPSDELSELVRKLKGRSSFLFNKSKNRKGAFWSQKFWIVNMDQWKVYTGPELGFVPKRTHFNNAMTYIENNRKKHGLPESTWLEELILSFLQG